MIRRALVSRLEHVGESNGGQRHVVQSAHLKHDGLHCDDVGIEIRFGLNHSSNRRCDVMQHVVSDGAFLGVVAFGDLALADREQTETAQARATRFAEIVLEDSDLADEIESLTPEEYADRRGIIVSNPVERTTTNMANGNGGNGGNGAATKADLEDTVDQVQTILEDAYTPESSREDLAAAVGDALQVLDPDTYGGADDSDNDDDQG